MTTLLSEWARRYLWIAHGILVASLLVFVYYAIDREPPFRVVSYEHASAARGEYITLRANVWRDPERKCAAEFSRFVFAADGARYDLGESVATPEMIASMETRTPGKLIVSFRVPPTMTPGDARLSTSLLYRCNKVHGLWPIHVQTEIPFLVLP